MPMTTRHPQSFLYRLPRLGTAVVTCLPISLSGLLLMPAAMAQDSDIRELSSSAGSFIQQAETRDPAASASLMLFNQIEEHDREIRQLRGQIEQLQHELKQVRDQGQQRYMDLEDRLTEMGEQMASQRSSDAPSDSDNDAQAQDTATPEEPGDGSETNTSDSMSKAVREAYQQAFSHVQSRRFDQAIEAFTQFVNEYPETALTANGHYWLGELYTANDQLALAEQALKKVVVEFQSSNKVPDALYKLALVEIRQGRQASGEERLNTLIDAYPQSSAASLASDYLND